MRNPFDRHPSVLSRRTLWATAALSAIILALPLSATAAQPTVGLGSASSFAVLAGAGITNTGPTTVSGSAGGDMGSHPTGSFTGEADVTTTGTKYLAAETAVEEAKAALVTAYDDVAGRIPATTVSADLGGQTLVPGVYNSATSLGLTGALTLDAEGDASAVFIFQAGSTLTTASSSSMVLQNGAQACNVFWQVGSSATFGTGTQFVGHVLALDSISATTGATFNGQLLARNGAVTLDTNTIVNDACAAVVTPEPTPDAGTEAPAPAPEDQTVDGGELPVTGSVEWIAALAIGAAVFAVAAVAFARARKRS